MGVESASAVRTPAVPVPAALFWIEMIPLLLLPSVLLQFGRVRRSRALLAAMADQRHQAAALVEHLGLGTLFAGRVDVPEWDYHVDHDTAAGAALGILIAGAGIGLGYVVPMANDRGCGAALGVPILGVAGDQPLFDGEQREPVALGAAAHHPRR